MSPRKPLCDAMDSASSGAKADQQCGQIVFAGAREDDIATQSGGETEKRCPVDSRVLSRNMLEKHLDNR
jgi:1,4-dihydroxy-2-naphthoyl-CoA synthase